MGLNVVIEQNKKILYGVLYFANVHSDPKIL